MNAARGVRKFGYTSIAMLAFAGNSVICRLALQDETIDPASFTGIRLSAGALTLLLLVNLSGHDLQLRKNASWTSAGFLFAYAILFSLAYLTLSAGTGALILFSFVQATMIIAGLRQGDKPNFAEWVGWSLAMAGLIYLLLPGQTAPSVAGSMMMAAAGISWGMYSLRGRTTSDPLCTTTANFIVGTTFVLPLLAIGMQNINLSPRGICLAAVSGALTSGLGYVVWYAALKHLSTLQAALVQLSVPAIAAVGGTLFLLEEMTTRLLLSTILVLGGISFALVRQAK